MGGEREGVGDSFECTQARHLTTPVQRSGQKRLLHKQTCVVTIRQVSAAGGRLRPDVTSRSAAGGESEGSPTQHWFWTASFYGLLFVGDASFSGDGREGGGGQVKGTVMAGKLAGAEMWTRLTPLTPISLGGGGHSPLPPHQLYEAPGDDAFGTGAGFPARTVQESSSLTCFAASLISARLSL